LDKPTKVPHHGTVISAYVISKGRKGVVSRDYNTTAAYPVSSRKGLSKAC
jgi:hypothetical protein